jgi:hypothetical protein
VVSEIKNILETNLSFTAKKCSKYSKLDLGFEIASVKTNHEWQMHAYNLLMAVYFLSKNVKNFTKVIPSQLLATKYVMILTIEDMKII